MIRHQLIEFVAGDDWEINVTLLDEAGHPYDLTQSPTIKWRMYSDAGVVVNDSQAIITVTDPANGGCSIFVAAAVSTTVPAGIYTDALRLIIGGESGTLLFGSIDVIGDPWRLTAAVASSDGVIVDMTDRLRIERHLERKQLVLTRPTSAIPREQSRRR